MKLATVKVEYTCGLTLTDRVTLDSKSGEIHMPPRLIAVMATMEKTEGLPVFSLQYMGYIVSVEGDSKTSYKVQLPEVSPFGLRRMLKAILYPTKDQYQQNGRLLHTFCAAATVGAVGYWHAAQHADLPTVITTASLVSVGVICWYVGFQLMKGE